ncbi:hypothetical protein [Rhizobium leguminosarum]
MQVAKRADYQSCSGQSRRPPRKLRVPPRIIARFQPEILVVVARNTAVEVKILMPTDNVEGGEAVF